MERRERTNTALLTLVFAVQFKNDANLRKKYDELVAFSVNLTAERDILNNALEQAKRDLNREMAARMSAEDSAVRAPSGGGRTKPGATAGQVEEKVRPAIYVCVIMSLCYFILTPRSAPRLAAEGRKEGLHLLPAHARRGYYVLRRKVRRGRGKR